ncbi:MAG: alpha/beta hydrolase, partial [Alphaproteobacteria bacterium]|nr:alpha/beta hydrolase [Alphaproteobacteria bacterium]
PASGLITHGDQDKIALRDNIMEMVGHLQMQEDIDIRYKNIAGANHFYDNHIDKLDALVNAYLDERFSEAE